LFLMADDAAVLDKLVGQNLEFTTTPSTVDAPNPETAPERSEAKPAGSVLLFRGSRAPIASSSDKKKLSTTQKAVLPSQKFHKDDLQGVVVFPSPTPFPSASFELDPHHPTYKWQVGKVIIPKEDRIPHRSRYFASKPLRIAPTFYSRYQKGDVFHNRYNRSRGTKKHAETYRKQKTKSKKLVNKPSTSPSLSKASTVSTSSIGKGKRKLIPKNLLL